MDHDRLDRSLDFGGNAGEINRMNHLLASLRPWYTRPEIFVSLPALGPPSLRADQAGDKDLVLATPSTVK